MTATEPAGYCRTQKILHWAVVLLLLAQYFVFDGMGRPFRQTLEAGSPAWSATPVAHAAIGVAILLLALARLVLRRRHGNSPEAGGPRLATAAARVTHGALYASLIGLPLTGLVAWAGGVEGAGNLHAAWTNVLMLLILLHVAAVVVHQFLWRTPVLQRMT